MEKKRVSPACAAIAFFLAACGQEAPAPAEPSPESTAQREDTPTPAEADLPVRVLPSSEVFIERIESLMISRPSDQPGALMILASGLVGSRGWTRPRLVPAGSDQATGAVSLYFVATSPPEQEIDESEPQPVEARLEMPAFPSEIDMVRVVGATNELTALVGN
jgi:hypothetical protein